MTEHKLLVEDSIVDTLPSMVRNELAKLPAQRQAEFVEEYKRKHKSMSMSFVLAFFWLHYAHYGRRGMQFLFWLSCLVMFGLIWWIVDLFRMHGIVTTYNKDTALEVMRNLKAISS